MSTQKTPLPQYTNVSALARYRRYAWILVLAAIIGAVWSYVSILRQPAAFVSNSRMFVSGRVNVPDASSAYSEELANYLGTQSEIMRSNEVLSRARQRVLLEQPGISGSASIDIRVLPGTSIFKMSSTGDKPDYCRAFLDAVMVEFIQFKRERRMVNSQVTMEQISTELSRLEKEINVQEQNLLGFKERNNINYWEQQTVSSARFLADLRARESSLRMQLSIMDSWEKASADRGLSGEAEITDSGAVTLSSSNDINLPRLKLDSLMIEREELMEVLRPAHPKIVRLNEEISRNEKLIAMAKRKLIESRKDRRAAMQSELDGLAKSIAEWEVKSLESSRIEAEYQKIRTSLDRTRDLYGRMLASLQNLDTRKGVDQELVQVLQSASVASPVDPGLRRGIISGLFSGLLVGVGVFFVACKLDDSSFAVDETIERLGTRSLAEIPRIPSGPVSTGRRKFSESVFDEAFRRLRSLVLLGLPSDRAPVLLVTSALPTEGKSEVAINLAKAFARAGKRVLLVDADLRRGRVHRTLPVGDLSPGFCELLMKEATEDQVIRNLAEANLSVITTGRHDVHVSEILSASDIVGTFESLRTRFDVIVVDSAPIGPVDDTSHLLAPASRVLFVVRMRHTPMRQALKAISNLKVRGASDIGLVLNRVHQEGGQYYYSYHK